MKRGIRFGGPDGFSSASLLTLKNGKVYGTTNQGGFFGTGTVCIEVLGRGTNLMAIGGRGSEELNPPPFTILFPISELGHIAAFVVP